jgi:hypothetical protein
MGFTVTVQVAVLLSAVAVIVAVPGPTGFTIPMGITNILVIGWPKDFP